MPNILTGTNQPNNNNETAIPQRDNLNRPLMTTAYNQPTKLNHTRIMNIPSALIGLIIGKEVRNME